ncbi:U3 small nucleolar RNA-associated protein NOL7 [Halichoeres trimaculatus]|uniref:U3 small nucleolar RNA-associated protein NOL7 n=1 Tax=Halichoeres trimaculatus TaxID=147232 RepID=UPI003D9E0C24
MVKKQRGEKSSSSKRENVGEEPHSLGLELGSSDDEAPEEVTFEDSKAEALRSMKQALDRARREKELLKEKRRKRQMLFQEQKKRKLLSDDVLEEIDSASKKKTKTSEDEAEEKQDGEEEEEGQRRKKKKKKKSGSVAHTRNLKGSYTVTTGKERALTSCQQQAAQDFIQSRLYGPGSCRTTNNELLSLHNKTGTIKSAAVQFVKKEWACKEKAKAEKLKKRWVHKQQISTG